MTQPPGPPWDPNATNPAYGSPPPPSQPGYGPPQGEYGYPPPPQQPGYGAPPPGGYPPAGGYPPPGHAAPPPGYTSSDDKTYALVAHFGGAVGTFISGGVLGWVGGLIALLAKGNASPVVKEHAKAALNFYIPLAVAAAILFVGRICSGIILHGVLDLMLGLLLGLLQFAAWVLGIVFGILGGIKANEGTLYKYPVSFPIIK
jgi:uncharacterized Tic20 family protein